jgi:hypothetical protein
VLVLVLVLVIVIVIVIDEYFPRKEANRQRPQ